MKHIITTIVIALTCIFLSSNAYGQTPLQAMVNKNNTFVEFNEETDIVENPLNEKCVKGSAVYYMNCLGYSSNEVICTDVATFVNMFNKEIIFYFDFDNSPAKNIKIKYYSFVSNLKSGIEKHNIRQEVVEKSLGVKAVDNIIVDESNGFIYEFNNGVLIDYKNINGLSDDANDVKNDFPNIFAEIENNAKRFYSTPTIVNEYISKQCKYFRNINMSYIRHASNPEINYNYALLYSIFYPGMTLDDFNFLVPESKLVGSSGRIVRMRYNNYYFIFEDNVLIK